jgi:alginate O-acetyltransferase complex protein AlgI
MVFNSLAFALFLPIVLALYYLTKGRLQKVVLLTAGYVFYGFWDSRFLFLVSLSTVLDFCTGLMIGVGRLTRRQRLQASAHFLGFGFAFLFLDWKSVHVVAGVPHVDWSRFVGGDPLGVRLFLLAIAGVALAHLAYPRLARLPEQRRRLFFLRVSLIGQLGMLGTFKYCGFFIESAAALAARLGLHVESWHLHIILPIGISFYTFQTLSYVCDVYWRKMEPVEHLLDFAIFVSYFPPLVAGPIERASHLIPRILAERRVTFEQWCRGAFLVALGMMKKVAIADGLAPSVASIYNTSGAVSGFDVAVSTAAFAAQIYCDFSGYSDIACGVSLFFGIDLLKNFDHPYFSLNPAEFWRRWHISLSSWLRDYLYIPLGGSKGSVGQTYRNLMVTMVLGGLWHGAAWNFVLWGFYQGLLLVVHRWLVGPRATSFEGSLWQRLPRMAFFFVFVCYGWLLFRANSFAQIAHFTHQLVAGFGPLGLDMKKPTTSAVIGLPLLVLLGLWQFSARSPVYYRGLPLPLRGLLFAALVFITALGTSNESQQFIYFQF